MAIDEWEGSLIAQNVAKKTSPKLPQSPKPYMFDIPSHAEA